jgi:hypothetical protein
MGDAEQNHLIRKQLSINHPNLATEHFRATSPADKGYNCLAWAAHDTRRIWHPSAYAGLHWPGEPQPDTLEGWVAGYAELGFQRCESSEWEPGIEKLAIYGDETGPSHVARQLPNGLWTSKMGKLEDIEHTLQGLSGGKYGHVQVILQRSGGREQLRLPV